jgi:hypothetical protein
LQENRKMKRFFCFFAAVIIVFSALPVWAEENVTPYGDFCTQCTTYGAGKNMISPEEAVRALEKYYAKKGCQLGAVSYKGRFVEVDRNGRSIDKILFDRKTGRVRSIY